MTTDTSLWTTRPSFGVAGGPDGADLVRAREVSDQEHACARAAGYTVRERGGRYDVIDRGGDVAARGFLSRSAAWIWAAESGYAGVGG